MARRPAQPRSLVAAARRITATTGTDARPNVGRQDWQADAWSYYDLIGEVKHAIRYRSDALAKLRLFPAVRVDPDQPPIPVTDEASGVPPAVAAAAVAELERLTTPLGGRAEIQRRCSMNFDVAGEAYIIGRAARQVVDPRDPTVVLDEQPESWNVHSVSEVDVPRERSGKVKVRSAPGATGVEVGDDDTVIRLWQPHPQWSDLPDSALGGVLIDLEALHTLRLLTIGEANSKRNNGFLLVPNEITVGSPNQVEDDDQADPDEDPFFLALEQTVQDPIADPGSPSAVQPTLVRGPAEALAQVRHVIAARSTDASIDSKIAARVEAIARGLPVPVEVVMGHQQTTFANAAQVDRDVWEDYLQPGAEFMCSSFTFGFLAPNLADNPVTREWADRIVVWYDESDLITQPVRAESAADAHDKLVISDAAYREALGWTDEDAPDEDELLRRTGLRRGILTGDLTLALLKLLGVPIPIDAPAEVPIDSTGTPQPIDAAAREAPPPRPAPLTAGRTVRGTNVGARLRGIDRDLRLRLTVAADAAMERALERAGNRLRSKSKSLGAGVVDTLRNVPATHVAATLGPTLTASAATDDELLAGAWDTLERQFFQWGGQAQNDALATVLATRIGGGFTPAQRDMLGVRQADDLNEAWRWMRGSLGSLAEARLFSPDPSDPKLGEFDPTLRVPTGLVRQAIARAGGATDLQTSGTGDVWVALHPGDLPAGGIGTGPLIGEVLRDGGATVEAFAWVYGPGMRKAPFDPHLELDGVTFENFDDPVLAATGRDGWVGAFFFPGDHSGCFPAGTLVAGPRPNGATLRHYEGEMVTVSVAGGDDLTATPNHPILTQRGWVGIGELVEGDEVVRCVRPEAIPGLIPHDDEMPSRIEDAVRAFSMTGGVMACGVPVTAVDFDGDGTDGDICVVWSDRLLMDDAEPPLSEHPGEEPFAVSYSDAVELTSSGGSLQRLGRVGSSPLRFVGVPGEPATFRWRPSGRQDELSLPAGSWLNPEGPKPVGDRSPIDAEVLGESVDGLAGFVEFAKVIEVNRSAFAGHVFNLTTAVSWYVANNLIVHNCQCDYEMVVLGPDGTEVLADEGPTPDEWLADQIESEIRALGASVDGEPVDDRSPPAV